MDIYENLKIPFGHSYFSALIHTANNSKDIPYTKSPYKFNPNMVDLEDSSSRFTRGSVLCCDSINDSDVNQGTSRIWKSVEDVLDKV